MALEHQVNIEDILKHLKDQLAEQAQTIAVLKATIDALTKPKPTTTAAAPVTDGPQGI
jgi:uncharacterized coiled-coil protein SlyX